MAMFRTQTPARTPTSDTPPAPAERTADYLPLVLIAAELAELGLSDPDDLERHVGPDKVVRAAGLVRCLAPDVVADLVDVTRLHTADPEHRVPHLAFQPDRLAATRILPMEEVTTSYYLRMRVADRPGVLADITRILANRTISIDAMIQREPGEGEEQVDIIMLTHETQERNLNAAIKAIEGLPVVAGRVTRIRLEELGRS